MNDSSKMIEGHSNYKVSICIYNEKYAICKECDKNNADDSERLRDQITKQILMSQKISNIFIPKFIAHCDNKYYMEYIYFSINVIDFFECENIVKVDWFANKLIAIVNNFLVECKYSKIEKDIIDSKLISICDKMIENDYVNVKNEVITKAFEYLYKHIDRICQIKIPVGTCHGDLTFSNILIDNNKMELYLIDFLDSFIESPLLDVVKIRQDSKYLWTLHQYKYPYNANRVILCFNHIDSMIDKYFGKHAFYRKGYEFFQLMNLMRVLQYVRNNETCDYLIKCIATILPDYNENS